MERKINHSVKELAIFGRLLEQKDLRPSPTLRQKSKKKVGSLRQEFPINARTVQDDSALMPVLRLNFFFTFSWHDGG